MAVRLTPEELAVKWAKRLKTSVEDIRAGVERVTEAPGLKAAEKADKWQARISELSTKEKWARRVAAVSLDDWKIAIIQKGLPRISAGVDAAQPKMVNFAVQLIAHQNAGLRVLEDMPDLTLEDNILRMTSWVRHMSTLEIRD